MNEVTREPRANWWETLYDDAIADLFLARQSEDALAREIRFLMRLLDLKPGDLLFDQCCGIGTQSLALAAEGLRVIGVDQCARYTERARAKAEERGLAARFEAADATRFRSPEPCHAGVNWGTSFGNGPNDETNLAMARRAFESLRPGAAYAVEFPNMAHLIAHFQPVMVRRRATAEGEWLVLRESTLNLAGGSLDQVWTIVHPDGTRRTNPSSVRLYLPSQLAELLAAAGFGDVQLFGGTDGDPLDMGHARCICIARRPL